MSARDEFSPDKMRRKRMEEFFQSTRKGRDWIDYEFKVQVSFPVDLNWNESEVEEVMNEFLGIGSDEVLELIENWLDISGYGSGEIQVRLIPIPEDE